MNGLARHYHLVESTVIFRGIKSDFDILFHCSMKLLYTNIIALDRTRHSAASHLGLYSLPMSHKMDGMLIRVNKRGSRKFSQGGPNSQKGSDRKFQHGKKLIIWQFQGGLDPLSPPLPSGSAHG